jgi:hypothetical protein
MRPFTLALLCALTALGCGAMVAPTDGDLADASVDAANATVLFRVKTTTGTSWILASNTRVRVENASRSFELRADAAGIVPLDLAPGSRWNLTFVRADAQIMSILDFVVPDTLRTIDVFLPPMESSVPRYPDSSSIGRLPIGSAPVHIRGRLRNRSANRTEQPRVQAHPYWLDDAAISEQGDFDIVVASFPNAPPVDLIVHESYYPGGLSPVGYPPIRAVVRRIDPRPTTDTTIEIDLAEAVPVPPQTFGTVSFPREGLVQYRLLQRLPRSARVLRLENPFGGYGEARALSGESFALPDDGNSVLNVRYTRISSLLPQSDELGPIETGVQDWPTETQGHAPLLVQIQTSSLTDPRLSVPVVRELLGGGATLGEYTFTAKGEFTQFGATVVAFARDGGRYGPVWTVWGYGPPDPNRTEPYRLPRLPEGVTVAGHVPADAQFAISAFMSTLPASQPGYAFWRRGAEGVRVEHGSEAVIAAGR